MAFFLSTATLLSFPLDNFWRGIKKISVHLRRYDLLKFLLNTNSLVHIKRQISATATCFSPSEMKGHHDSHLFSDGEGVKSVRNGMYYKRSMHQPLTSSSVLCKKCCLPFRKSTDDADSKKTWKNEPFYSIKYLWYSLIHSHITFCLKIPQLPTIILEFLFPDTQIMILDLFPPTTLHICQYNWYLSHSLPYAFYSLLSAS